jgi:Transcriptional regulator, AbiEi antitoxin
MSSQISPDGRSVVASQGGVVARRQAAQSGIPVSDLKSRVRCGDWQRLRRGVYATFTGAPDREAELWAALLRAGPGAVLSHHTAAERHGLVDEPSPAIHIAVPAIRDPARSGKIPGVVVHRTDAVASRRHPAMSPPCTRIEDTVLDLIKVCGNFEEAYDWICRAVGRRRTTADRLRAALKARPRFPMRDEITLALGDAQGGALSVLERRYVDGVERPHGIPAATRQAGVPWGSQGTGRRYLDNLYEGYLVCVEIDGAAAHPADAQWGDKRRDRANLVQRQIVTMRIGHLDLYDQPHQCKTAADVAAVLSDRGPAVGHPCGADGCVVPCAGG